MTKTYSPAKDDQQERVVYCVIYYYECMIQIARVYDTYREAQAYLSDPTLTNPRSYKIITGHKYKGVNYD